MLYCNEIITECIRKNIDKFMQNYYIIELAPSKPQTKHQEFIENLIDYFQGVILSMKMIREDLVR